MAHGKETPRQKMIGMMYLVLTAMLALNVSATVLDAFVLVDSGLSQTSKSFVIKNERLYNQMDRSYAVNPTKVGPWKSLTDEIKLKTSELFDYIQDLKVQTIITAEKETSQALLEGNQIDTKKIGKKGDTNVAGRFFLADGNGKAYELRKKIAEYREFMLSQVDPTKADALVQSINNILNTDDPPETKGSSPHTWETTRFDHVPIVSVFPQLTKMQLDILNVEAEVVNYLLQRVDASDFKVNKLDAVVIPNSNIVFKGDEFSAEVFLAASDTTQVPRIFIGNYESFISDQGDEDYRLVGNYTEIPVVGGKGIFKQKTGNLGVTKWGGLLEVTAPDGSKLRRPFKHQFTVEQPNIVVSPTKMNVFYLGVDNPVEISIPGISMDKIDPKIDRGAIRRSGNEFIVNPGRGAATCNITVWAEVDGVKRNMGTRPFRIRDVPDPLPSISGIKGRTASKGELVSAIALEASMPVGFDFDLKYTVTSFTVLVTVGGFQRNYPSNSQLFTEEQKRGMDQLRPGNSVILTDIKAVGPGGSTRELVDLVIKIR